MTFSVVVKVGAIGLDPQAESAQPLTGCGPSKLGFLKTEIESFMPFYQAERLIYEQAQPDQFNKGRY